MHPDISQTTIHARMHAYRYMYLRFLQRTTLPARSASRIHEHAAHASITYVLISSHIHYSDEPNAIIFIQVLALSHRAHAGINLEPQHMPVCADKNDDMRHEKDRLSTMVCIAVLLFLVQVFFNGWRLAELENVRGRKSF